MNEIKTDPTMLQSTKEVINLMEDYKNKNLDDDMVQQVLKIQKLVREIESDG